MALASPILQVAVPSPLRRLFDYRPPEGGVSAALIPGQRVTVPFGRQQRVGVIAALTDHSNVPPEKLRHATALLDEAPVLTPDLVKLLLWAADYYHHPPGEVFAAALPTALREGREPRGGGPRYLRLTPEGEAVEPDSLGRRAPVQQAILRELHAAAGPLPVERLAASHPRWQPSSRRLREHGWVEEVEGSCLEPAEPHRPGPVLVGHQAEAVTAIVEAMGSFRALLLHGITGSGKTEVYLQSMEAALAAGGQVLVLVPEIGLTPQLLDRFRRLGVPLAVLHSGLTDSQRLCAWYAAWRGEARVVVGTRSAVFVPLPELSLVVVDEEHDTSYKQQEGFRYSGRDLAVVRGHHRRVPVVLGSATPSLESLVNVEQGRYHRLSLPERAGGAAEPPIELLDLRGRKLDEGLGESLLHAIDRELSAGGQVLLFLNRRGFAPTLLCHDCGFVIHCHRCDAHLTFHQGQALLRCHHCGNEQRVPPTCPNCGSLDLRALGMGTERVEQALTRLFPQVETVRIDRDSTRARGRMEALLEQAHSGAARILLGTQMLAKGHHFPDVTLVGILDADQGLHSPDFRSPERLAQLIIQVAGRAGRAERPGRVLIQTHHPEHPLLNQLIRGGYDASAEAALEERRQAQLPPYSHMAILRAEAQAAHGPFEFLAAAAQACGAEHNVLVLGPVPAPMERRAGRYRAQLLLQADRRSELHRLLTPWLVRVAELPMARRVRWSLDVDPIDLS